MREANKISSELRAWTDRETGLQLEFDDDEFLEAFYDKRYDALWIGTRTCPVDEFGTADFTLFGAWDDTDNPGSRVPGGKASSTVTRTYATWGRCFLDLTEDLRGRSAEDFREHVRSQIDYCAELDDDRYVELTARSIGRKASDGPHFDDIDAEWVADKLDYEGDN